jgi:phosphoribosyl 1,2-cyclic phosphodiesterase
MLEKDQFKVKFWGTRGSIPTPGKDTIKYGGNTLCVEIRCGETLIIIDGGTGLRLLGNELIKRPQPLSMYLFFSHFHWDHIQGFPFFTPAFVKENVLNIYGESKMTASLEDTLSGQMFYPNFPIELKQLQATFKFNQIKPRDIIQLNSEVTVKTDRLNHPGGALSYRVEYNNKSLVYATDTEHLQNKLDENVIRQAHKSNVFIYDTTYTEEEYESKIGWGHSTYIEGCKIAREASVDKFILFHHDPSHNDDFINAIEKKAKKLFTNSYASFEGLEIVL